jgi:predicted metal-dependent hydrolase
MMLPENYTVLFKNVKNVGIRVSQDQRVRIVAPAWLPEHHLEHILKQREGWIRKHLHRLRTRKQPVPLAENQILFKGNIYRLEMHLSLKCSVEIDDDRRTIRAGSWFFDADHQRTWYKNEAKTYFEKEAYILAERFGYRYNKISVRSQKTRWGSCSKRKNLSFNWKLIKAPPSVIEYLILHELVHTEFMNHSRRYWQKIQSLAPDYQKASQWLKEHGREL